MRNLRLLAVVLSVVATVSGVTAIALAGTTSRTTLVFSAKYAGKANVHLVDQIANYTAAGAGTGKLIGAGKITGKGAGDTSKKPCSPFGGVGLMKGTKGSLSFKAAIGQATACADQEGQIFSLSGHVKVLKGTGKFAHARGMLKFTGVYDRAHGTFSVKFFGSLTT